METDRPSQGVSFYPIIPRVGGNYRTLSDFTFVNKFSNWSQKIQNGLLKGRRLAKGSKDKLTSFVWPLCRVHKEEMRRFTPIAHVKESRRCVENHHYLYQALRLCYDFGISSKLVVGTLLREIFICEGSLQAVFSAIQPAHIKLQKDVRLEVNINSYTLYKGRLEEDQAVFEYFVSNITILEKDPRESEENPFTPEHLLNMPIHRPTGKLITPLMAAVLLVKPDLLLFLLRMGADPLKNHETQTTMRPRCPVQYILDCLSICTMFHHGMPDPRIPIAKQFLELFSRAAYVLDIRRAHKKVLLSGFDVHVNRQNKVICEVSAKVDEILDVQSYRQPPSLQHACRMVIRGSIAHARKDTVFQAVKTLPVPLRLKMYLDLQF